MHTFPPRMIAPRPRLSLALAARSAMLVALSFFLSLAAAGPTLGDLRESTPLVESVSFESADGTRLHGSLWRAERPGAGLLIVHGLESHAGWFERSGTPERLAAAGVTVLAYDRRGSGRSDGVRGDTPSAQAMLEDLAAARSALARALATQGAGNAPLHALANCFGTRLLLPFAARDPRAFVSLALTAPATRMSRAADYGAGEKLKIVLSPGDRRFATPVEDELFVDAGPALEWIRADPLALREVTARFLRATARLTREMKRAARTLEIPALVVLGSRDAMVDNARIRADFVARYRGPVEVLELDAEHYVDFTPRQRDLAAALATWIQQHTPADGPR